MLVARFFEVNNAGDILSECIVFRCIQTNCFILFGIKVERNEFTLNFRYMSEIEQFLRFFFNAKDVELLFHVFLVTTIQNNCSFNNINAILRVENCIIDGNCRLLETGLKTNYRYEFLSIMKLLCSDLEYKSGFK